jgi:hypothetical protein
MQYYTHGCKKIMKKNVGTVFNVFIQDIGLSRGAGWVKQWNR